MGLCDCAVTVHDAGVFFFSSRRRHTRCSRDWSSDVCSSDLVALPGTQAVGGVSHLPLDEGKGNWYSYYWADGAPADKQNTVMADHRSTLPGYFRSLGATMLAGREFYDTDDARHTHVAIVDETIAEQVWPGQEDRKSV